MCPILLVWFGMPILDNFLVISWDLVHIFQNQFLRWNRESEPVNTKIPIIRIFFLQSKRGQSHFQLKKQDPVLVEGKKLEV